MGLHNHHAPCDRDNDRDYSGKHDSRLPQKATLGTAWLSILEESMPRKFATQQQAADRFEVSDKTIRNWISKGLITGYKLPGSRAIRVDLDEIERMLSVVPATVARTPRTAFGPKAKIVSVAQPVVVTEGGAR